MLIFSVCLALSDDYNDDDNDNNDRICSSSSNLIFIVGLLINMYRTPFSPSRINISIRNTCDSQ